MQHPLTRFVIGFLSGVLGMLAGWTGLASLVIALAGPDRDGGLAMGAFFNIGPVGGLVGFAAGVLLFIKIGQIKSHPFSEVTPSAAADSSNAAPAAGQTRVSAVFAVAVLAITAGLGWWGWYELIRSPYLTHGYMTLRLQFKLPPGMALPSEPSDVHIMVGEGEQFMDVNLGRSWHGTDGDRRVILASASLMRKTSRRSVTLELPGVAEQIWQLDLASDPDPTPGYSPWRLASRASAAQIEMNFSLTADR
jgi:hypothetical protein